MTPVTYSYLNLSTGDIPILKINNGSNTTNYYVLLNNQGTLQYGQITDSYINSTNISNLLSYFSSGLLKLTNLSTSGASSNNILTYNGSNITWSSPSHANGAIPLAALNQTGQVQIMF